MIKQIIIGLTLFTIMTMLANADTCAPQRGNGKFFAAYLKRKVPGVVNPGIKCDYLPDDQTQSNNFYFVEGDFIPVSGDWVNSYPIYMCTNAETCVYKRLS